jgi:hypothetical protein
MKRTFGALALAGGAVLSAALPAAASTHYHQLPGLAITHLYNRPDSGNGTPDTWATDTIQRDLTIRHLGGNNYSATVTDEGSFVTIPGNPTPNQGPGYLGDTLTVSRIAGARTMLAGKVTYTFTASHAPDFSLVPSTVYGSTDPTGTWFKLAFPAGTVFTGGMNNDWTWTYSLWCPSFNPNFHPVQTWTDAASNGAGNLSHDGNIFGC